MKIRSLAIFLLFVSATTSAAAEPRLLENQEMEALFRDGLEFVVETGRANLSFEYSADGTWEVRNPRGETSKGIWQIRGHKLCRKEEYHSDGWNGLPMGSVCAGIKVDGVQLFMGGKNLQMTLKDPAVLARIQGPGFNKGKNQVAAGASNSQAPSLDRQREALEAEKLELERQRIELERQRLEAERTALLRFNEKQTADKSVAAKPYPKIDFGTYHALIIGVSEYKELPKLNTALIDARAVAEILRKEYGYKIHLMENPTRGQIIDKLDELRETMTEHDNLLIYYAGHGWLDPQSGRGYWLPANASTDRRSHWFSNSDLTDALQALFAKHVMVVADSCYSGTLTRSIKPVARTPDYIERMAEKRTRVVLSSGGLEPVADSGGGQHSVFAAKFLEALENNQNILEGTRLFELVRRNVVLNAEQTPQYSDIRRAGHEGGDFLFVRKSPIR